MPASLNPPRMVSPLRPPTSPLASTGTSRALRARATFIPLPPASATLSVARCLWPSVRLGTTRVRSTAALRVTVRITCNHLPFSPAPRLQVLPLYTTTSRRIPPRSLLPERPGARLPVFRPPGQGLRRALQWAAPCVARPAPRSPDETLARRRLARALWCRRLPDLRLARDRNGEPNAPPTGPEHRPGGAELRVRAPGR